jgi:DNA polymerase-3 subunit delta'
MSLPAVRGRGEVRRALVSSATRGDLPAALLLYGDRGVGKQRLALWIGQLVLCESPGAEGPCDRCRSCKLALRLEHPDLHWYFPVPRPRGSFTPERLASALEEARFSGLSEIREQPLRPSYVGEPRGFYLAAAQTLRRRAHAKPSMGTSQVFVVGEADHLVPQESSPEAANALLKLLEEPPGDSRFILTSARPGSLLSTIRSRTVPLHLVGLGREEVEAFLVEVAEVDAPRAKVAAALAGGSIGRALGFLPDANGDPGPLESLRQEAWKLLEAAITAQRGRAFGIALGYRPAGARGLLDLFALLDGWIRDLAAVSSGAREHMVNEDAADLLEAAVRKWEIHPASAAAALDVVQEARDCAQGNVNPQLIIAGLVSGLRNRLVPRIPQPA